MESEKYVMPLDHPLKENERLRIESYVESEVALLYDHGLNVTVSFPPYDPDNVFFKMETKKGDHSVSTSVFIVTREELHPLKFNFIEFMETYGYATTQQFLIDLESMFNK